ncbi:MAG: Ig-like domain-containing protein, partial [Bacillota bacterium]|nr:Ig-like domain-containing protein [Bacillota bacterium]
DYATVHYTTPLFDKYNWDNHKDDSVQFGDAINLPTYNGTGTTGNSIESKPNTRKFSGACIQILSYSDRYMQVIFWDRNHTHDFEKTVLEPAGPGYEGTAEYYCYGCGCTRWESIPALPMSEKFGEDGTRLGKGASKEAAHKALTSYGKETDPKGSVFSKLKLKTTKQTKKSIKLSWNKAGAKKYVVYGRKCGKGRKLIRLRTTTSNYGTFSKIGSTRMKARTYYKFIVVALDADGDVISTSKMIHVATKGSKYKSNHTSVYVAKKIRTKAKNLRKGRTLALKAKAKKKSGYRVVKHVGLRYQSSNTKIVTVTSKGTIKGIKKGKAKVWAYAQDGVYRTIYVTVK